MKLFLLAAASAATFAAAPAYAGDVTVTVTNVEAGSGEVWAVLQSPSQFLKAEGTYKKKLDATATSVPVMFKDVAPGSYVVAVVQDTNKDGKIELGAKGPTEAWGLSGQGQKGKPEWMPAAVRIGAGPAKTTVALKAPK